MATIKRRDSRSTGRMYTIDGQDYPSVTTILQAIGKPALVNWAAKVERELVMTVAEDLYQDLHETPRLPRAIYLTTLEARIGTTKAHTRELEKAGEIGTQAHALIQWRLCRQLGQEVGPEPFAVDAAIWAVMAFEDWAKSVSLVPLRVEQTVYSKTHRYAGTTDLVAKVLGRESLVDFKTGKAIYPEAYLQLVAYEVALREMSLAAPEQAFVVRIPKNMDDPAFEVATVPPVADLFPIFLAVRQLWDWQAVNDAAWRNQQRGLTP